MRNLPLIGDAYKLLDAGCIPGASFRNLDYAEKDTWFSPDLDYNLKMAAFDAQTSGGLLISVPMKKEKELLQELRNSGLILSEVIGTVSDFKDKALILV